MLTLLKYTGKMLINLPTYKGKCTNVCSLSNPVTRYSCCIWKKEAFSAAKYFIIDGCFYTHNPLWTSRIFCRV